MKQISLLGHAEVKYIYVQGLCAPFVFQVHSHFRKQHSVLSVRSIGHEMSCVVCGMLKSLGAQGEGRQVAAFNGFVLFCPHSKPRLYSQRGRDSSSASTITSSVSLGRSSLNYKLVTVKESAHCCCFASKLPSDSYWIREDKPKKSHLICSSPSPSSLH